MAQVFKLLIFPGLLFLLCYSLFCAALGRKLDARMQNAAVPAGCSRWPT